MLNVLDTMPPQSMQLWTLDMQVMSLVKVNSHRPIPTKKDTQPNHLARQDKTTNARSTGFDSSSPEGGPYGA
jgi:hypothetical protein